MNSTGRSRGRGGRRGGGRTRQRRAAATGLPTLVQPAGVQQATQTRHRPLCRTISIAGQPPGSNLYNPPQGVSMPTRPPHDRAINRSMHAFDETGLPNGLYTQPINQAIAIRPFNYPQALPAGRRNKPRVRIVDAALADASNAIVVVPTTCHVPNCVETFRGNGDEVNYQAHMDAHNYEFTCCEDRCRKFNGIFKTRSELDEHHTQLHSPAGQQLPTVSNWCPVCCHNVGGKNVAACQAAYDAHKEERHPNSTLAQPAPRIGGGRG